jgi:hypothetical protein
MTSLATSFVAGAALALLVFSVRARCLAVVVRIKQVTSHDYFSTLVITAKTECPARMLLTRTEIMNRILV